MKQGTIVKSIQNFTMKVPGTRGRSVSVKINDLFIVTSPLHTNKERVKIDRKGKAQINSGYQLEIVDFNNLFEVVE